MGRIINTRLLTSMNLEKSYTVVLRKEINKNRRIPFPNTTEEFAVGKKLKRATLGRYDAAVRVRMSDGGSPSR